MIHLSKETLGDFEPDSLVYEPTEHQWEKKLKNRITNGSVSPLAVMDRMLKTIPRVFLALNEKDILHDEGEMLFNKLNAIRLVFNQLIKYTNVNCRPMKTYSKWCRSRQNCRKGCDA